MVIKAPLKEKKQRAVFAVRRRQYTSEAVAQRKWHKKRTLRYLLDVCAGKMRRHIVPGDLGLQYIFL